jgi:hypothetical protein
LIAVIKALKLPAKDKEKRESYYFQFENEHEKQHAKE